MSSALVFTFEERPNSRHFVYEPPHYEMEYLASGIQDDGVVQAYAMAGTASTIFTSAGTLYRENLDIRPNGYGQYVVTVPYGPIRHDVGSYTWNFDSTGGTVKVKGGLAHISSTYGAGFSGAANPHGGLIGVPDGGGEPEGVDIVTPSFRFNVTFRAPPGMLSLPYARLLATLTGKTNSDQFLGFQPSELLFLGATGADGSMSESECVFNFDGSTNATNIPVGSITVPSKNGHDRAWVQSVRGVASGNPVMLPFCVHVDQVYSSVAFASNFGWGGF